MADLTNQNINFHQEYLPVKENKVGGKLLLPLELNRN